jgi:DeoR/GlpR family transcriptional regulator of sugar metabolism
MLPFERRQELLTQLRDKKSVNIAEAAKQFHIGEATIRRDLEKLEIRGLARRIYGGAVLLEGLDAEIPMDVREKTEQAQKEIIGRLAAELVEDGDVLILDSSSTTLTMIDHLKARKDLTIITNGLKAADLAGDLPHAKVYCCGGRLSELSKSLVGMSARQFIRSHSAKRIFFSCRAVNYETGICDSSDEEAELRQDMIAASSEAILLAAYSKFNATAFCRICGLADVDAIVTDSTPDALWVKHLSESGVRVVTPDAG